MTNDLSKIDDPELQVIWVQLLAIIEKFERKASHLGASLSISSISKPEHTFLIQLANLDETKRYVQSFNHEKIRACLLGDAQIICEQIQVQIDHQLSRQREAYERVRRTFSVYPSLTERLPTVSKIALAGLELNSNIAKLDSSLSQLSIIEEKADILFSLHTKTLDEIWSSVQNIEKYHNDNRRFSLAQNAQFLSVIAIVISVSGIAIPPIYKSIFNKNEMTNTEKLMKNIDANLSSLVTALTPSHGKEEGK